MNTRELSPDPDLTVAPVESSDAEREFTSQFIAAHKAFANALSFQKIIINLLKSGKLTIEEIAQCLQVPKSLILTIQISDHSVTPSI